MYLLLEKGVTPHLSKLKSHIIKDAFWKLAWTWPIDFALEKENQSSSMQFCYFTIISPLKMGVTLHLNKLEFPFTKQCLILSLDSIGQLVLEKILKCCHFVSPFGKGCDPSFDLNSFHPKMLWLKFSLWFWRRRWNVYTDQT